jgi:hypothetical protein
VGEAEGGVWRLRDVPRRSRTLMLMAILMLMLTLTLAADE